MRTNVRWHHFNSEAWPKGKSPHFGAQVDHSWFHRFGGRRCKLFTLFSHNPLTPLIQAQFMISPDRTFSETGAISRINYRDRFKQYKRLIIKNANTPRMSELVVRLERELLQVYSPDSQDTGEPEATNEEDDFCLAFESEVVLGDPIPPSPISAPSPIELAASLPNPYIPGALLPTIPVEQPAVPDSEEPTDKLILATKTQSRKGSGGDKPTVVANNRRSARNAGGTARKAAGGKTTKA